MLPIVANLALHMVDRPRREIRGRTVEAAAAPPPETHRRGRPQRDADDMLEDRAVLVPADTGAGPIFDDERLLEARGVDAGESSSTGPKRREPAGYRLARREAAGLEIIGPAVGARQPFSFPLLELERRETGGFDMRNQRLLCAGIYQGVAIGEAGEERRAEQIGLRTRAAP